MKRICLVIALLASCFAVPAQVQAQAQSKVGDWTVEKRAKDDHCNASRGYKDTDDENRDYVMVVSYSRDKIVFVVIYDGWEWQKTGDVLRADFSSDKTDIIKKAKWEVMDKTTLRGVFEFDQKIIDAFSNARRISIDFENDDDDNSIEFQTPRAGEALAALKFCEENRK